MQKTLWKVSEQQKAYFSKLEAVKTYTYMRVRLMFDPPNNSSLIQAINDTISELEWRLNIAGEANQIGVDH